MWLLHLLPDSLLEFIVNAVLILGVVLTILSFFVLNRILRLIPGLASYHTAIQVVSVLILAAGLYFKGGYVTEMMWREEVKRVQEELNVAKNKATWATMHLQGIATQEVDNFASAVGFYLFGERSLFYIKKQNCLPIFFIITPIIQAKLD